MAESTSLKKAVKTEVKEAAHEAKTGNVTTAKSPDIAHRQKLEDDRAAGADLPTGVRRDHPPA